MLSVVDNILPFVHFDVQSAIGTTTSPIINLFLEQVDDSSLDWVESCLYYHDYCNFRILAFGNLHGGFRSHCNSWNETDEKH